MNKNGNKFRITFEDRINSIIKSFQINYLHNQHVLITDGNVEDKMTLLLDVFSKFGLKNNLLTNSSDYDFVIVDLVNKPSELLILLKQHNGKIIIFKTDKVLSSMHYIRLLMGAICSNVDDGHKQKIRYNNSNFFTFNGCCFILTNRELLKIKKDNRFNRLIRDMIKMPDANTKNIDLKEY